MKRYFNGLMMAFGMFSIFPTPRNCWDDGAMNLVMCYYPFVGLVIGLFWWAIAYAATFLPIMLGALVMCLYPFLVTGFIHADGLMDCCDSVFSRRELAERQKILKDSHVGAFAVAGLITVMLTFFAGGYTILQERPNLVLLVLIPITARAVISLLMLKLRPMKTTGYIYSFKKESATSHMAIPVISLMLVIFAAFWVKNGLFVIPIVILSQLITMSFLYKQLDGVSGDLCGATLVVGEMIGIIALGVF